MVTPVSTQWVFLLSLLLCATGCGDDAPQNAPLPAVDAGSADVGDVDGAIDGRLDLGPDQGPVDPILDGTTVDEGVVDTGTVDEGVVDAGAPDGRVVDAATADEGVVDAAGGPVDECATGAHDCDPNALCVDTVDAFECTCGEGFQGDGRACIDVDECAVDNGGCTQSCINYVGSFGCCAPNPALPGQMGCDGIVVTDAEYIEARSDGIAAIPGPGEAEALRIDNGQSMDVVDEGCLQLGRDGADFGLSFWLRTSGNQDDAFLPGGQPQIIGTKSQYGGPQGFVILARLEDDGRLRIGAHSAREDNRRNVNSVPFEAGAWAHVVVNYRNAGDTSSFTLYVNMVPTTGEAHPDVYNENLRIGDEGWGEMPPFDIAAFRSYGRVLGEREIRALFLEHAEGTGLSGEALSQTFERLSGHLDGQAPLDADALAAQWARFSENALLLSTDEALMREALDLVDLYEENVGPLFMTDETRRGFSRSGEARAEVLLARGMWAVQQAMMDQMFTGETVRACRGLFAGRSWETANYFPGAAPQPEDPDRAHTVTIKADAPAFWGRPVAYASDPVRRPTGFYLPPGSIGQVRVPPAMVNAGYRVLVGAHTADHSRKDTHKRLDRVSTSFPITDAVTHVANPLGGGVYIMVPYLAELGLVEVHLSGVIEAPFFSLRPFDETAPEEWARRREAPAPWADFESEKLMMQLPRSWIYAFDDPHGMMRIWDRAMDGVSELLGYPPEERNRTVLYHQVDVHIRHGAFGIGYPQVNNTYDPYAVENGNKDHWILTDPLAFEVEYHELGHGQLMSMFPGETESIVNFPHAYVRNVKFDVDFDLAFRQSFGPSYGDVGFTPDDAAIHWMITDNFRNSAPMDRSNTTRDQFRYQQRGYAKYADIARLFDWDALRNFYHQEHLDYMADVPSDGLDPVDSRILRLSIAAEADLTPLIHFWGVHPVDAEALQAGMVMHGLGVSPAVRDQLVRYADIAPADNVEFNAHYERVYPGRPPGGHPDYGTGWYNRWRDVWAEAHATEVRAAIQRLLDQYYPGTRL